jgi:hypothetical protein
MTVAIGHTFREPTWQRPVIDAKALRTFVDATVPGG